MILKMLYLTTILFLFHATIILLVTTILLLEFAILSTWKIKWTAFGFVFLKTDFWGQSSRKPYLVFRKTHQFWGLKFTKKTNGFWGQSSQNHKIVKGSDFLTLLFTIHTAFFFHLYSCELTMLPFCQYTFSHIQGQHCKFTWIKTEKGVWIVKGKCENHFPMDNPKLVIIFSVAREKNSAFPQKEIIIIKRFSKIAAYPFFFTSWIQFFEIKTELFVASRSTLFLLCL